MIQFNTLKVEGFAGIIGYKTFKLDPSGLNVITGPNGTNKSTRFNALAWAIYGKPLKEKSTITTWEHLQPEDYQGTLVSVSFFKGDLKYKITRCKDYKGKLAGAPGKNRLLFETNGVNTTTKDKRDIQREVTALMGLSYELFINTIIFPQKVTRFIEEGGASKKKILEESFQVTWVTKTADLAKAKRTKIQSEIDRIYTVLDGLENNLESINTILKNMTEAKIEFEKSKEEALVIIDGDIKKLNDQKSPDLAQYNKMDTKIKSKEARLKVLKQDKLYTEYDKTYGEWSSLVTKKDWYLTEKAKAESGLRALKKKDVICPLCGQDLDKAHEKQLFNGYTKIVEDSTRKMDGLRPEIRDLADDILNAKDVKKEIRAIDGDIEDIAPILAQLGEQKLKASAIRGRLEELEKKRKEKEEEKYTDLSKPVKRKKWEIKKKIQKEGSTLIKIERNFNVINWVINTPLSNSGIKAFLFNELLKALNARLSYYERFSGLGIELEVDMETARKDINTIVTKDGAPVAYNDLSGGESQLANVTVALAQNDILSIENPSNLYVMDEVFEGLDDDNTELVGNLLADKASNRALFVITHNDSFNPRNSNIIRTTKNGE